ncbi:hypothetical protein KAI52_03745 [Candidatus Parcubacteria bacterium]|nr:hypothetical protein [Candidatus Parcubacteria bacterium]
MTKNKKFYKKLYCSNNCNIRDDMMPKMITYGTKTWAHYFVEIGKKDFKKCDMELLENVEYIEFDNKKEMFKYWDKLADEKKIDWNIDFDYPEILRFK